ncbi:glucanotransferase domain of glycogen debranching enzyme-domain-containing protein [Powellomyces hirtus]|nr:glucanotransferase domain of glycogen debranching enzyme-domain-containing protein [Powellomyces hirtus]
MAGRNILFEESRKSTLAIVFSLIVFRSLVRIFRYDCLVYTRAGQVRLPLNGISILTVIPKWMPTLSGWLPYFATFSRTGYNMVHFAPLNTRGSSNSPYSIFDQMSLSDDLFDGRLSESEKEVALKETLDQIRRECAMLSVTDIVWNHTACNSVWLQEHPEAGYNLKTAPHLRSAFEIEEALLHFSETWNKPIETEKQLEEALHSVKTEVLPKVKLWEFYIVDVIRALDDMRIALCTEEAEIGAPSPRNLSGFSLKELAEALRADALLDRQDGKRHTKGIDFAVAQQFMRELWRDEELTDIDQKLFRYEQILNEINLIYYQEHDADLAVLIENISSRAKYLRLEPHGPRLGALTRWNPLVDLYFTRLPRNDVTKNRHPDELSLANNGWIWNADPLVNFAAAGSKAYLRREVIAWGDCVKLRYGDAPEDSPWLWSHQIAYTKKMARLFNGLRIDNCHSTPIRVAAALLDAAREVNPDLYVFAELFSGSEEKDIMFVSKLGINSLIREAMNAWDPKELSRLVHRHGGQPVGSLTLPLETFPLERLDSTALQPVTDEEGGNRDLLVQLTGSSPHALFMDCTHDNEMPHQKRTAVDTLPNAAIVAMTDCAVGSVFGYDEIVPQLLDLVNETRKYSLPRFENGINGAKAILYDIHLKMAREGFSEIHVHQEHDFLSIHRIHPITHDGYLLIARSAFKAEHGAEVHSPITLQNQVIELLASATLSVNASSVNRGGVEGDITGLPCKLALSTSESKQTHVHTELLGMDGDFQTIIMIDGKLFVPGSVDIYRTSVSEIPKRQLWYTDGTIKWPPGLHEAVVELSVTDINVALYRCGSEEQDTTGDGAYDVPDYGKLSYCGLQGFVSALQPVARTNDLGHAIFCNLRSGSWIPDYILAHLDRHIPAYPSLSKLRDWLAERLALVKRISPSFLPKYFTIVIFSAYQALCYRALTMTESQQAIQIKARHTSLESFSNACLLMTFQLYGRVKSTGLVPAAYPLAPLVARESPDGKGRERLPALAAGLPHFATQYMRCWGRDIFISLRGSFIQTGHYDAARAHLIAFGSTLRHGLIPNLLDQGISPRYNARDAAWWWIYGVGEYCRASPEGYAFLGVEVARRFTPRKRYRNPDYLAVADEDDDGQGDTYCAHDDQSTAFQYKNTIAQICHELMERHAHGIKFREWNAGPNLDHAMRSEGFDVQTGVDWDKGGIVMGGNRWNCGTWMDKMGDSEKAKTKGVPATPRDGAAVEICGLTKYALTWIVDDILGKGLGTKWWKWDSVAIKGKPKKIMYKEWNSMLQKSFEEYFFIPTESYNDPKLINRRGIYKDTVAASLDFMSFQLRPNFCMAMVVAPEMFNPDHARYALTIVKDALVGPLGIKTLDPKDWAYRGVYDNANDGTDSAIAHGFNYHQGPEWVYPLGFFLRAYLYFFTKAPGHDKTKVADVYLYIQRVLLRHKEHILNGAESPYAGLPELTNENGAFCNGSCPTQAWSGAVMVELIADLIEGADI